MVVNPYQKNFMGAFQNGLKDGNLNEYLAQNHDTSMVDIMELLECYIKGEEKNA